VHEGGHVAQRHEVILNILPGGDVPLAAAEILGDHGQLLHLRRRQQSPGDLAPHHLHAGLPLPVDAVLQAEGTKLVFRDFADQEGLRPLPKGLDFLPNQTIVFLFELLPAKGIFLGCSGHSGNLLFPIEITMFASWMQ
jgi:hypothetical protein